MKNAPADSRNMLIGVRFNESENERIVWAANELGLSEAAFTRMAALKLAKEILG